MFMSAQKVHVHAIVRRFGSTTDSIRLKNTSSRPKWTKKDWKRQALKWSECWLTLILTMANKISNRKKCWNSPSVFFLGQCNGPGPYFPRVIIWWLICSDFGRIGTDWLRFRPPHLEVKGNWTIRIQFYTKNPANGPRTGPFNLEAQKRSHCWTLKLL